MLRWSDLGAGLWASPRVLLRLDLWLDVLRRALFSRVFLGYVLVGSMLFMASRQALQWQPGAGIATGAAMIVSMVAGSIVLLVFAVFLLPYAYWAFNPVAARVLQDYLKLPPDLDQEPWFGAYLWWTLPVLGASILFLALQFVPMPVRALSIVRDIISVALLELAIVNLFARSALSPFYASEEIARFLHASRWQRRLVWLPLLYAVGWALQQLTLMMIQVPALAWVSGVLLAGADANRLTLGMGTMGLALLINLVVSAFCAAVLVAALLLACDRMVSSDTTGATSSVHSITMPYPPRRMPAPPAAALRQRRGWRWAAGLAIVAGGLYVARMPLADWYLSHDVHYRDAAVTLQRLGLSMNAGTQQDRLQAGYVQAGCQGDMDRMRWLRRIGLDTVPDSSALTCAICSGRPEAAKWLLAQDEALAPAHALRAEEPRHRQRNALSCAAGRGDTILVRTLLARGAKPGDLGMRDSAVNVAAERLDWAMVNLLLRADPAASGAAIFGALDAARAQDPQRPAQLLPQMMAAGLPLGSHDEFQRSVFHWAAMRHDLPLARALMEHASRLPADVGPAGADRQGALPWMHVLRKAQLDGRPLNGDAAELLRLLLPAQVDANIQVARSPDTRADALPEGWSARDAVLNDPAVSLAMGTAFDIGRLPADPAKWWKFSSVEAAERFVLTASATQLMRAENPDAPAGMEPIKLSTALADAGWPELAKAVKRAVQGQH